MRRAPGGELEEAGPAPEAIPYDPADLTTINVFVACRVHGTRRPFMHCPLCDRYPCRQLTEQDLAALEQSPLMTRQIVGLREEKRTVILIKKKDGTIVESDLDIQQPTLEQILDVVEVYVVKTVLVPDVVLRPKPKDEREKIVAEARAEGKKAGAK